VDTFQKFSPGVYLMFRFLKHVIMMFCVIAGISAIQLTMLLLSPYYQGFGDLVRINMLRVTIASLQPQFNTLYVQLDWAIVIVVVGFLVWWS
jgi:hypothetical protein